MEHLIENAVKHGDKQYCESLGSFLKEKDLHPQKNMTPRETYMFLRRTVQTVQTSYSGMPRVIARLQNFQALGFSVPQGVLSNDIIPHMIDLETEPGRGARFRIVLPDAMAQLGSEEINPLDVTDHWQGELQ